MPGKKRTVYIDAGTGEFVKKSYAKRHKKTTFGQRVPIRKRGKAKK